MRGSRKQGMDEEIRWRVDEGMKGLCHWMSEWVDEEMGSMDE